VSTQGTGTYHVRLVARHGGDTEDDNAGRRGTARQVSIGSTQPVGVALTINVEDVAFSTCAGGSVAVPGATVRVAGGGFDQTRTADAAGRAVFSVPPGAAYTITASSSTCLSSATATALFKEATTQTVRLPNCFHPSADLVLTSPEPWPGGTAGSPYYMKLTVRHAGLGGPSRPADLRIVRVTPGASTAATVSTQVYASPLGAFCPSQVRTITGVDPSPPLGTWMYHAILVATGTTTLLTDRDDINNMITRDNVSFLAAPTVSAEVSLLNITSFRLQTGATSVTTGTPVSLNATTSGQVPREYKAGECGSPFDASTFRTYTTSPVPSLPGFTTAGSKIVCLQMRGSSVTSATARDTIQVILPADLNPTVAQSSNPIIGGEQQTYTVSVSNSGGLPAGGIVVQNTISSDLEFVSATIGPLFNISCSQSGTTVTCTLPLVSAGQSATIRIVTRLPLTAVSGHEILFTTKVDPNNAIPESNETNNQASAVATTSAVVAPTVDYNVTSSAELSELFRVAHANGLQMLAFIRDADHFVCPLFFQTLTDTAPLLRVEYKSPLLGLEGICVFELFSGRNSGRTRLATGWQLNDVQWEFTTMVPLDGSWRYVTPVPVGTGNALFAIQMVSRAGADLRLKSIRLRGPAGRTWRDAFAGS
jgi:uncharacterized repeat protein (TIGR01451 family)